MRSVSNHWIRGAFQHFSEFAQKFSCSSLEKVNTEIVLPRKRLKITRGEGFHITRCQKVCIIFIFVFIYLLLERGNILLFELSEHTSTSSWLLRCSGRRNMCPCLERQNSGVRVEKKSKINIRWAHFCFEMAANGGSLCFTFFTLFLLPVLTGIQRRVPGT